MGFTSESDRLTPESLCENRYQCSYVKSVLNQSIGKLSQSKLHSQVEFVYEGSRLTQIFSDTTIEMTSAFLVTPSIMQVTYKKKDSCLSVNRRAQCIVNSMVTSFARQYLDSAL